MGANSATEEPQAAELHRRVGRNLLLFQSAEESLRLILPYVHPEAPTQDADARRTYRTAKVDGKPLGSLIGEFNRAVAGDKELIAAELKAFLDARNELVHGFYRNPRFSLLTHEGVAAAIVYLDEQYMRVRDWVNIFRTHSLIVLLLLIERDPQIEAEYGVSRNALIDRLPEPHKSQWLAGE